MTQITVEKLEELLKKQKNELKNELKHELTDELTKELGNRLKYAVEDLKEDAKEKFEQTKTELKSNIATFKDQIVGRLDKIDQDLELLKGDKNQLEDHEVRIDKLEQVVSKIDRN